jgi:hypothetical protein
MTQSDDAGGPRCVMPIACFGLGIVNIGEEISTETKSSSVESKGLKTRAAAPRDIVNER